MSTTAALIVAAGKNRRDGTPEPMERVGALSVAERNIATFFRAGIRQIVIVTGYKAVELEHHLSGKGIIFIRNEAFEETQMIDSVKLGLAYLKDRCDRVLFTPADQPLFQADTIKSLAECEAEIAFPVHGQIYGHPIMIRSSHFEKILSDDKEGGLKGALDRLEVPVTFLPVPDEGVLDDIHESGDYGSLMKAHSRSLLRPVVRVALARETVFLDEEMALLLRLIHETGSVRTACRHMNISYSGSWNKIKNLESQLQIPLITRNQGGTGGGKSSLTPEGQHLLKQYKAYEEKLRQESRSLFADYFGEFFEKL